MTHTTHIEKNYYGLEAVTEIPLNKSTEEGTMILRVTSSKRHNGMISTSASVIYRKDATSFSTVIFQDYSKTIAQGKVKRVTEKSLADFHTKALEVMPAILVEVATHYQLAA